MVGNDVVRGDGRAYDFVHFSLLPLLCRVFPINMHEPFYNLIFTKLNDEHEIRKLTLRRLMSYIYGAPILDVSRSHTTTQHSR